jgi:hypothetical protein
MPNIKQDNPALKKENTAKSEQNVIYQHDKY